MAEPAAPQNSPKRAAELILEVACEQFYRQGIRAVGVDEVVTRAGFTKPSLYRAFGSKEGLIGAYLKLREDALWAQWDAAAARHPHEARAQLRAWLEAIAAAGPRGCGLSNAAVEFPEAGHPARLAAQAAKAELRRRLRELARRAGSADPDGAGDGLLLLVEGALVSGQMFGENGPAGALVRAAEALLRSEVERPEAASEPAAARKPPRPKPVRAAEELQPMLF